MSLSDYLCVLLPIAFIHSHLTNCFHALIKLLWIMWMWLDVIVHHICKYSNINKSLSDSKHDVTKLNSLFCIMAVTPVSQLGWPLKSEKKDKIIYSVIMFSTWRDTTHVFLSTAQCLIRETNMRWVKNKTNNNNNKKNTGQDGWISLAIKLWTETPSRSSALTPRCGVKTLAWRIFLYLHHNKIYSI